MASPRWISWHEKLPRRTSPENGTPVWTARDTLAIINTLRQKHHRRRVWSCHCHFIVTAVVSALLMLCASVYVTDVAIIRAAACEGLSLRDPDRHLACKGHCWNARWWRWQEQNDARLHCDIPFLSHHFRHYQCPAHHLPGNICAMLPGRWCKNRWMDIWMDWQMDGWVLLFFPIQHHFLYSIGILLRV